VAEHDADVDPEADRGAPSASGLLARSLRIGVILLVVAICGITLLAWLGGEPADLPFHYGGFD
jgi:hypothetical protein